MSSKLSTSKGGLILGYTTRRHLILDLDNSGLPHVLGLVALIMKAWPKLGDCLVLQTSKDQDQVRLAYNKWGRPLVIHDRPNHHLVFDNLIGYNTAAKICRCLAGLGVLEADYEKIREFRGDMTLRVSVSIKYAGISPAPVEVAYYYNLWTTHSDGYIEDYRKFKKIGERLARLRDLSESVTDDQADATDGG